MKDGKRRKQMKKMKRYAEKKSSSVNCQIGISFVLWPSSLEQLSS